MFYYYCFFTNLLLLLSFSSSSPSITNYSGNSVQVMFLFVCLFVVQVVIILIERVKLFAICEGFRTQNEMIIKITLNFSFKKHFYSFKFENFSLKQKSKQSNRSIYSFQLLPHSKQLKQIEMKILALCRQYFFLYDN